MKRISITVKDGKITLDFDGFKNDDCSAEENLIRMFLAKLGAKNDVEHSDIKKEAESDGTCERERTCH